VRHAGEIGASDGWVGVCMVEPVSERCNFQLNRLRGAIFMPTPGLRCEENTGK